MLVCFYYNGCMKTNILKSILAGVLIGIGAFANVACIAKNATIGPFIGALLFSIGLISVFVLEANLYTGKIGSIEMKKDCIFNLLIMLIFNFIGIAIVAAISIASNTITATCASIVSAKLAKSWYLALLDAVMCGVLIELAVLLWKKGKNHLTTVFAIMCFILAGFEHCVANVFYLISGYSALTWMALLYLFIYIVGNSIGSILLHLLVTGIEKSKEKKDEAVEPVEEKVE